MRQIDPKGCSLIYIYVCVLVLILVLPHECDYDWDDQHRCDDGNDAKHKACRPRLKS